MLNIPKHESLTVEFKSCWEVVKDGLNIKKTLVAFANTEGGDIYVGIDDDGSVRGITDIHDVEERLYSTIRDAIFPSACDIITSERLSVDGKVILRIHVDKGRFAPYALSSDNPKDIYIRVGCTSSPARTEDIARMIENCNPIPYEQRISSNQDLTFEACTAFCEERGLHFDPKKNTNFGFWDSKMKRWTNLAEICSDQSKVSLIMIEFHDDEKTLIADSDKIVGNIFTILQKAQTFIAKSNHAGIEKPSNGSLERIDHYYVAPKVIREALINQILHRDYSKEPPNMIRITPSEIEFFSIGGLYQLTPEMVIEDMATSCRNERLGAFLSKLKLVEGLGTGFRLIRTTYKTYPVDQLLTIRADSFKISLPRIRVNVSDSLNEREKLVMDHLAQRNYLSRKDIEKLTGLSQASVALLLRVMLSKSLIKRVGSGPRTRYEAA